MTKVMLLSDYCHFFTIITHLLLQCENINVLVTGINGKTLIFSS